MSIVLQKMPVGYPYGVSQHDPDGAYVWGGGESTNGKYQIVVAGPLHGTLDQYRDALTEWLETPVSIVLSAPLARPEPDENPQREFLSIILQPAARTN